MRVLVFFDLPVGTVAERRAAAGFRKDLLRHGFVMMQESIYTKIAPNGKAALSVVARVRQFCPALGLVQVLTVTEKQYNSMELLVGEVQKEVINGEERLVVL